MKKIQLYLMLILSVTLLSCSSDSDDNNSSQNPSTNGFLYAENGSATMTSVSSPYANNQYKSIFAVNNSNTIIETNLTSLAEGSYTIDDATNFFAYLKPGTTGMWNGSAGTVTITANANNKLTGTFSITSGSGINDVTSLSGSFTDIPIQ